MRRIFYCCMVVLCTFSFSSAKYLDKTPHVLILSYLQKGGHAETANALSHVLKRIMPGIEVTIFDCDGVDFGRNLKFYDWCMKHSTLIYSALFHLTPRKLQETNFDNKLLKETITNKYDLVVCNFPIIQSPARRCCEKLKIPFVVIPPDIDQPRMQHWIQSPNSIYLLGSEYLMSAAAGYPNIKRISGMILRPQFKNVRSISKVEMKKKLGLNHKKPVVLILFGAAGADSMLDIAKIFKNHHDKQFVFICGTYDEMIQNIKAIDPHFIALGYTNNMHEYMRSADIFIGKPGPGCVSEAIQCETPVILRSGMDVMPQEQGTINYVIDKNCGKIIENYNKVPNTMKTILKTKYVFLENNAAEESAYAIKSILQHLMRWKTRLYGLN